MTSQKLSYCHRSLLPIGLCYCQCMAAPPSGLLVLFNWGFCYLLLLFTQLRLTPRPCELQHTRLPCPSLSPEVCSNSSPLSRWGHPTILSSVTPVSSYPQSFPESGSFPVRQLFISDGQSMGASALASVLPMNSQGWYPLGLTGLITLLSKGLSRVFSSTEIQNHQFFSTRSTLWHTWLLYISHLYMTTGKP